MKSLAIVRAKDILKLESKLLEMSRLGLNFECKPKEINPASLEKILSLESKDNEVCALVSLLDEAEFSKDKIKNHASISDVLVLNNSNEFFEYFAKLMPVLPDIVFSGIYKDIRKQAISEEKTSKVYLGVFVNRKVQVQTISDAIHAGVLKHADSIGVFFEPCDNSDPLFITWHDIKKIIIPKEGKR